MQNCEKKSKRLMWLDLIKGICMFFVLLSHSNPPHLYVRIFTPTPYALSVIIALLSCVILAIPSYIINRFFPFIFGQVV